MMNKLSNTTIATLTRRNPALAVPAYDRSALKAGIAHIGVGNFHRVHQAAYIDRCLHLPGHADWAICGIGLGNSPQARTKAAALAQQDHLYTVTEFGADGQTGTRVIGAMIDYLHAPANPEAVLRRLADPAIRIVTLTITEGGYDIAPERDNARTAFGYIVESLRRRRDAGVGGYTVVSCDNLRSNGDTARRAVLACATQLDAGLAEWIDAEVSFPNSMVDRIAPGISPLREQCLNEITGVDDLLPAMAEPYTQWVLEDRFVAGRPDFAAAGVELRPEAAPYEAIKGRMLNASHMLLAYPGLLLGYRIVPEAMADGDLGKLLRHFMENDVIPLLAPPEGVVLDEYKESVLARFDNPAIADQLTRVAHDGAAKIPVFYTSTLQAMLRQDRDCRRAAFLLACFRLYLNGVDAYGGLFDATEPQINQTDWALIRNGPPSAIMDIRAFKALKLSEHPGMMAAFQSIWLDIARQGVRHALRHAL
ncbi:mannitol dehydrogenase family protein [Duganella sp. CT11-25]|uniref:mannitol dehydrogenase family protein n=1 Tax=unclassified Duganella TaxID=2636909 RepID=UPI0039AF0FFA